MMLPEAFERALQQYDRSLSLRWGTATRCWLVERRERILPSERALLHFANTRPDAPPKAIEEWRSCQQGKHVIFYVDHLDNRVFESLWLKDVQRHGLALHDRTVRKANKLKRERMKAAHEKAKLAADVIFHQSKKRSDDLRPDVTHNAIKQALGLEVGFQDKRFSTGVKHTGATVGLLDAYARPITAAPKETKIHLATR